MPTVKYKSITHIRLMMQTLVSQNEEMISIFELVWVFELSLLFVSLSLSQNLWNWEITHNIPCYIPSHYVPSEPLLPCDLAYKHWDVRHGIGTQVMRVVDYEYFARWESKYYILIQFSTFDHIQLCFPCIFNQTPSLHKSLLQS